MESFTKNVHPLSVFFRNPPNFTLLASKYEYFNKHCKEGKVNFKKYKSCRALCRAILEEYFGVCYWRIPKGYLVPAVPQRMNYLCWIHEIHSKSSLTVLDIGTGANLIYPLLGVQAFSWSFIATEKHEESYKNAKKIVKRNSLKNKIKIIYVQTGILGEITDEYDVSMCNPPFFEIEHSRIDGFGGLEPEISTSGGEIKFIKSYIVESWAQKRPQRLFTCLIGIKDHLNELRTFLIKNFHKVSIKETALYQGFTIRWVLAWSFP